MNADRSDKDRLQALAKRFRWITRIVAPDAPGFAFFGGELCAADFGLAGYPRPASLSGKGLDSAEAFAGCVGEAVEHLSRLQWGNLRYFRAAPSAAAHGLHAETLNEVLRLAGYTPEHCPGELDWMAGTRLSDDAAVRLPAILCLRRPGAAPDSLPSALSTGCAAGPTLEAATLAGLLEVVERDAVALWWLGGRAGRALGLYTLAETGASSLIRQLRQGRNDRVTWLIDLTSDLDIPCIAALSARPDGRGFACGTAARLNISDAIRAALLELCQSELGHHLVEAKRRARGDTALNQADRRKLERAETLDARCCEVLYPKGFPVDIPTGAALPTADAIATIVRHCRRVGVEPLRVDLTRPELAIPAVRVVVPGLQPFPSAIRTARMVNTMEEGGPGSAAPAGMSLY